MLFVMNVCTARMGLASRPVRLAKHVRMALVWVSVVIVCIARMGFVFEAVPTRKSAAAINALTQVNIDVAVRQTPGIRVLGAPSVALAAKHVVIQRRPCAVEGFAYSMVIAIAAIASSVDQVKSVVSDRRGRYMAAFLRVPVIENAWESH